MTATVQVRRPTTAALPLNQTLAKALEGFSKSGKFYVRLAYDRPWLRDAEIDAKSRGA